MPPTLQVQFHYLKSNAHRVVHVDGVIGGATPNGHIHASFFSERVPIPTVVVHDTERHDERTVKLGPEVARDAKVGFVREVEVGFVLTTDMARRLRKWLGQTLESMGESLDDGKDESPDES